MANAETNIQARIMLALSESGCLIWRNNSGAWRDPKTGRVVRYGVGGKGASDLLGVAPDGRFLAVEVKVPGGRVKPEQEAFCAAVRRAGGRAGVARSVEEAIDIALGVV